MMPLPDTSGRYSSEDDNGACLHSLYTSCMCGTEFVVSPEGLQ